ncbi:hypothetical protein [Kineococcus aurantiacus]|uniref:Very-short-patch-repair endonuclease n=1 Tax=Kineococcus aurantiacus TaxID=37633 RepID=A0A7Y9DN07_9ACTN|nr:hypothetical protein [Kineococcus aurantiacus]NYD23612.1 very-short-patch-repair endonuclease [Kineococcus aurantiacus]
MSPPPRTADLAHRLVDLSLDDADRIAALAQALPAGAAISRRTAAALHGFHVFSHRERHERLPLECTVPRGAERVRRPGVLSCTSTLRGDVTSLGGLPVTTVQRTVLDIARYCVPDVAIAMLDRALRQGLRDRDDLLDRLEEVRGDRGVGQARHLLRAADAGSESPGESACRLRLVDAGFDRPQTQIRVERPNGRHYRLDTGWEERRLAVEYDGFEPHAGPVAFARDTRRRAWLAGQGWTVLVAHSGHVFGRAMDLELAVGEILGVAPRNRRRTW